jgi:alpha-tubulin suppressor-like RCC1 family protein
MVTKGSVYCWGKNTFGGAGDPPGERILVPRLVTGATDVESVAVSPEHSCALTNGGLVYCWGANDRGQVGGASAPAMTCRSDALAARGDQPCQPIPTRIEGVTNAVQVAVSSGRSCALLEVGTVHCWGDVNGLGDWPLGLTDIRSIALGAVGACAVTSRGELRCSDQEPERVISPPSLVSLAAVELSGDTTTSVGAFGCFLGDDGGVLCTGDASRGQLGTGARSVGSLDERALENTRDIALGAEHACALGNDGKVRCWGKNSEGQVGPAPLTSPTCESDTCEPSPLVVPGLPPIAAIAAGGNLSCAVAGDGTLWCWGVVPVSLGAPLRVAGPWEAAADVCEGVIGNITTSVYQSAASDRACVADADCVGVALNLSCNQTCAVAALSHASADATETLLAELEADACPEARALGCSTPEVTCPASTSHVACVLGSCTQR